MGYFNGMRAGLYRETLDGRKVYARRSVMPWRKRWYYVTPQQQGAFERRLAQLHASLMILTIVLTVVIGSDRILSNPMWLAAFVIILLVSSSASWAIAGLEPAHIDDSSLKPIDRRSINIDVARGFGVSTLWFMMIGNILMAAGQVYVIVREGAWWAWLGTATFTATSLTFARQILLLRKSNQKAHAS